MPEAARRADRIGAREQRAAAGVLGRALERQRHQRERLLREPRIGLALAHGADADENRNAGVLHHLATGIRPGPRDSRA